MLFGDVQNFSGEFKNRIVELTGQGANARYLTWSLEREWNEILNTEHLNGGIFRGIAIFCAKRFVVSTTFSTFASNENVWGQKKN